MTELENSESAIFQGLIQERNSRGPGRPPVELQNRIKTSLEHLTSLRTFLATANSLCQAIHRLEILRSNHHSEFFVQRIVHKQATFDQELERFFDSNSWFDRQLILGSEPVNEATGPDDQEIVDLYFSIFHNSPQEVTEMVEPFETFQKELMISTCSICQEISLSRSSSNSICPRCSKYPNLPLDQLDNLNQLNPLSPYNKMQPGAFFQIKLPNCNQLNLTE